MKNKKKAGLSDAELVAKYEAGKQPVIKTIKKMLSTKPMQVPAKAS
ncbi:MAG: hypothetical protein JNM41_09515 [Flavipsychrobacter sp.]|nr:hypothetical protein [Flavipsychrobacter sp.]